MKIFKDILNKSGLKLLPNGQGVIDVAPVVFIHELSVNLKSHVNHPKVLDEFVEGFLTFVDDINILRVCLDPVIVENENTPNIRNETQDSLVRLFLKTIDIQSKVSVFLLEKVAELSGDQIDFSAENQLSKLILFQFRWLETLADSKGFCEKLLEIFPLLTVELKKDVIDLVPEIIDDKSHLTIALAWNEYLKESSELTLSLLHSLTNLNVPSDILDNMKAILLELIESVNVKDLPNVVKILLQNVTSNDSSTILREMKVRLNTVFDCHSSTSEEQDEMEKLILDAFESSLGFQKLISEQLLKLPSSSVDTKAEELLIFDFFLLLMFANVIPYKKKADQVLIHCFKTGLLSEKTLETAFKDHSKICIKYHKPILEIAVDLLKSNQFILRKFGKLVYQLFFSNLNDNGISQSVIENLISHIRSGNNVEIDGALDVLLNLIAEGRKILSYGVYLKHLLNYLGSMSLSHIRKIYSILGQISRDKLNATDRSLKDDLYIIIRKQLSHSSEKYRLMGVIGAVSDLHMLVKCGKEENISDADNNKACCFISMIETQIQNAKDYKAYSLFHDELSFIINLYRIELSNEASQIDNKFLNWLKNRIICSFQDTYVEDWNEKQLPNLPGVKGSLQFDLNENIEEPICLNLLALSISQHKAMGAKERSIINRLPAHFRLLQICHQAFSEDGLDDINAVLGIPVYFLSENYLDRFEVSSEKEKKFIVNCCFSLANYFIELINAFASHEDNEIKQKVLNRLKTVVWLREKLSMMLAGNLSCTPFVVRSDVEDPFEEIKTVVKRKLNQDKSSKPMSKRQKYKEAEASSQVPTQAITQASRCTMDIDEDTRDDLLNTQKQKKAKSSMNLNNYLTYFRELDLEVFHLLKLDLLITESEELNSNKLNIKEAAFLYEDFFNKIKALIEVTQQQGPKRGFPGVKNKNADTHTMNRNFFGRSHDVLIKNITALLPFCRKHLDTLLISIGSSKDSDEKSQVVLENADRAAELYLLILKVVEQTLELTSSELRFNNTLKKFNCVKTGQNSQENIYLLTMKYFQDVLNNSPALPISVAILRCFQKCKTNLREFDISLKEIAEKILSTDWRESDRQLLPLNSADISYLLSIWLDDDNEETLKVIQVYLKTTLIKTLSDDVDEESESVAFLLTKKTLHIFCDAFYNKLILIIEKSHKVKKNVDHRFSLWKNAITIFNQLVDLTKDYDSSAILSISLKHSRRFLLVFIRFGMPILSNSFRQKKDEVLKVLKQLQISTRILQNVCSYSKTSKNLNLTNRVPLLKKELERLVFQVKKLLVANKCSKAFWIGNLKNRTLKGEEILSQPSDSDEPENEEITDKEVNTDDEVDAKDNEGDVDANGDAEDNVDANDEEVDEDDEAGYLSDTY